MLSYIKLDLGLTSISGLVPENGSPLYSIELWLQCPEGQHNPGKPVLLQPIPSGQSQPGLKAAL